MTLTYGGGDTPESRFLRKSDTTAFFKALRNDGHKIRYFAVGEYGSTKGRAHWHVVLFWQSKVPNIEFAKNVHVDWWPHGHTYWLEANTAAIRYVMKYINKENLDPNHMKSMAMSRKPILGYQYFRELAGRYVENGLAPQRPFYKFRDVFDKSGKPLEFYMPPLVRDHFLRAYVEQWQLKNPGKWWPPSEMVDKFHEDSADYVAPLLLEKRQFRGAPWMAPPDGAQERFDEKLNSFYCIVGGEKLLWTFDERGQRTWGKEIVTEKEAERRQAVYAARSAFGQSNA